MAESSKPTITEFLLARISEDEARARRVLDYDDPPEQIRQLDPHPATLIFYESRVLAECTAKRAIMDIHEYDGVQCLRCGIHTRPVRNGHEFVECATLKALTSVYADHPDYDPRWAA